MISMEALAYGSENIDDEDFAELDEALRKAEEEHRASLSTGRPRSPAVGTSVDLDSIADFDAVIRQATANNDTEGQLQHQKSLPSQEQYWTEIRSDIIPYVVPLSVEVHSSTHFAIGKTRIPVVCSFFEHGVDPSSGERYGGVLDAVSKKWLFPFQKYRSLISALQAAAPKVQLQTLFPPSVLESFLGLPKTTALNKAKTRSFVQASGLSKTGVPLVEQVHCYLENIIPEELWQLLLPYQKEGVVFCIQKQGKALIGDEMGLGKTLQAIATMLAFPADWPVLVICPSSMRVMWGQEFERFSPRARQDGVAVMMSGKDADHCLKPQKELERAVYVVSYDLATKWKEKLVDCKSADNIRCKTSAAFSHLVRFKAAILDESHYLKNGQAQRTKACLSILKVSDRGARGIVL